VGQVNQASTLLDQLATLRKELAELRKRANSGAAAPVVFERVRIQDMPAVTNSEFETVWEAVVPRSYPLLDLYTVEGCDGDVTGEGQLVFVDTGTVAESWTVATTLTRVYRGPYPLPSGRPIRIAVQYRRTAGSGNVYTAVLGATQHA
jgi:hypothetical protein